MFVTYLFNKPKGTTKEDFFLFLLFLLLFCSSFSSQPNVNVDHLNHRAHVFLCAVCFLFLSILFLWSLAFCILTNKNFSQRFTSLLAFMLLSLLGAIWASDYGTSFHLWCKRNEDKKKIMQIFATQKFMVDNFFGMAHFRCVIKCMGCHDNRFLCSDKK